MKFKHIIWDFNGTIIDDVSLGVDVFNALRREYGLAAVTKNEYVENFKIPVIKFYEETGFDFTKISFREVGEKFVKLYSARRFECPLTCGVREAFGEFSEMGVKQSVLSAYENGLLNEAINHYGIARFFARVDGLNNIDAGSKIELGKRHVAKLGIETSKIIMIGDTPHDKEVADAMGVSCALVACGHTTRQKLEKLGVPVFENPAEFKKAAIVGEI